MLQRADHQKQRIGAGLIKRSLGSAEDLDAVRCASSVRGAHTQDAARKVRGGGLPLRGDVIGKRGGSHTEPRRTGPRERVLHRADAGHVAGRDAHRLLGRLKVEQPIPERQVKEPGKQRVNAGIGSTAEARGGGGHLEKDTRPRGHAERRGPCNMCARSNGSHQEPTRNVITRASNECSGAK